MANVTGFDPSGKPDFEAVVDAFLCRWSDWYHIKLQKKLG
jgi:hypothetical protein